ncbi:hypothetical protein [Kitasatospora phosalacinea]|uniref:Uncharacterized protein n=1 Tax=Kitasatospora phosalacinea TaxID=2065 RepID=A0A9W6PER6_9ACTN|nr:hypothetical protein [Kitasatospora phosalacinea]GLW53659.1 hypothetical protein Kpho01_16700 [Kitasatospora phosalacinea]
MGTYVTIRGWVECDERQLPLVQGIAEAEGAREGRYRGGWSFPPGQTMWTMTAFFAACGRAGYEDAVREVLRQVAALPASDEDDDRVVGLFRVHHEVDGATEWQLRDGTLLCVPAPPQHDYLDA